MTLRRILIGAGVLLALVVMLFFLAVLFGIYIGGRSGEDIDKEPAKEESIKEALSLEP